MAARTLVRSVPTLTPTLNPNPYPNPRITKRGTPRKVTNSGANNGVLKTDPPKKKGNVRTRHVTIPLHTHFTVKVRIVSVIEKE